MSLGAGRAGEPGKNRPAIVISDDALLAGTEDELIVVVPLSASRAPSALRPRVTPTAGIDQASAAICRGVRAVVRSRLLRPVGAVAPPTLREVEHALGLILGL